MKNGDDPSQSIVKVGDFGFARTLQGQQMASTYLGSPMTMAPEVAERKDYDERCDVYSLGVVFYQMLFGDYPYKGPQGSVNNPQEIAKKVKSEGVNFNKNGVTISKKTQDLLGRMIKYDPKERMNFSDLFEHEYFNLAQKEKSTSNQSEQPKQRVEPSMRPVRSSQAYLKAKKIKVLGDQKSGKSLFINSMSVSQELFKVKVGQETIECLFEKNLNTIDNNSLPGQFYKETYAFIIIVGLYSDRDLQTLRFWSNKIQEISHTTNVLVIYNQKDGATENVTLM